jgi:hypothetical protein
MAKLSMIHLLKFIYFLDQKYLIIYKPIIIVMLSNKRFFPALVIEKSLKLHLVSNHFLKQSSLIIPLNFNDAN